MKYTAFFYKLLGGIIILFVLLGSSRIYAATVTIGSGTSNDYSLPAYGLYDYGVSGMILLQSELGAAKTLTNLSVQFGGYTTPYTFYSQDIYLAHVTESAFDAAPAIDLSDLTITNLTKVVNAQNVVISPNGWITINFDINFSYNGTSNLVIKWENRDASWTTGYGYAESYTAATNRGFEKHQDTSFPTGNATVSTSMFNIKFDYTTLPVELISSNLYCSQNDLRVEWVTAWENDVDYFRIEGSEDLNLFNVKEVISGSNLDYVTEYSYLEGVNSSSSYYRIMEVDVNGTETVLAVFQNNCKLEQGIDSIEISCRDGTYYLSSMLKCRLEIFDVNGSLIQYKTLNKNEIHGLVGLSRGIYFVRIRSGEIDFNRKIVCY